MITFPCAKINIGLNIVERLTTGYHALETVMIPIPLYDVLEILPAETFSFQQSGLNIDGDIDNNLCVKAFNMMKSQYKIGNVYMHLHKRIPFGAGLGGGSSDATSVVKVLNTLFKLNLNAEEFKKLVAQLGSDCAFFVNHIPQLATGRGEILQALNNLSLKNYILVVVKPEIYISTQNAYSKAHVSGEQGRLFLDIQKSLTEWKHCIKNDFETSVFKEFVQLKQIKEHLYSKGALYASMSGSGAAMYGFFEKNTPQISIENCEIFYLNM